MDKVVKPYILYRRERLTQDDEVEKSNLHKLYFFIDILVFSSYYVR